MPERTSTVKDADSTGWVGEKLASVDGRGGRGGGMEDMVIVLCTEVLERWCKSSEEEKLWKRERVRIRSGQLKPECNGPHVRWSTV